MRLPATSAPLYFHLNPAARFVNFNQFAYPALQVQSVLNRATELPIIQGTGSAQPVWSSSAFGGAFVDVNFPGATSIAGMTFSGAQFLEYDALASQFSGTENTVAIVMELLCGSSGGTAVSFGSTSAATPRLTLSYSGGTLSWSEVSSGGTATTSATVDNAIHVVSAIRSNNTMTLRVDGAQVGTPAAITAANEAFNTFVVGALNNNGAVSSQFNGKIGITLVYGSTGASPADIFSVEKFLLSHAGLTQNPAV